MNRILRHVGNKDFKRTRQRQIDEQKKLAAQKLKEQQKEELERKQIEEAAKPYKSDWRTEISEAMTTAGMGMINYIPQGDIDLGTAVSDFTLSGTGIAGWNSVTKNLGSDRSKYDTIVVTVNSNSAEWEIIDGGYNTNFVALGSGGTGNYTVVIPRIYGSLYYTAKDNGSISFSTRYQRRSPVNLFVSLDDPEANSFMRGGLGGDKERRAKLKDMLDAGNELMTKLGLDPSKTSPGDIALDTIPYEEPSPGPGGYKPPGSYDPNKFYNLDNKTPMPSPNLPSTGPGRSSVPDGTKVAASYPKMTPLEKLLKDIKDQEKRMPPGPGKPGKGRGMGDTWEGPGKIV